MWGTTRCFVVPTLITHQHPRCFELGVFINACGTIVLEKVQFSLKAVVHSNFSMLIESKCLRGE